MVAIMRKRERHPPAKEISRQHRSGSLNSDGYQEQQGQATTAGTFYDVAILDPQTFCSFLANSKFGIRLSKEGTDLQKRWEEKNSSSDNACKRSIVSCNYPMTSNVRVVHKDDKSQVLETCVYEAQLSTFAYTKAVLDLEEDVPPPSFGDIKV